MKYLYSFLLTLIICLVADHAIATSVAINGTTVFQTNYEADAATALTFTDALNTDADDLDPTTTQVGSWYSSGVGTTGVFEDPNPGTASYDVASKQVQVTSSTSGIDPRPLEGVNYLRGVRTNTAGGYTNLWEVSPSILATDGNDLIHFETAIYLATQTAPTFASTLVTFYDDDVSFMRLFRLFVNQNGDLLDTASADTGVDLPLNQWNILSVDYLEGSGSWTVSVGDATSGPLIAEPGVNLGASKIMSFGGGTSVALAATPYLYFDGVATLPVQGDYNDNGVVDAADYVVWRDTFGSNTDLRANGDDTGASMNLIDEADYAAWVSQFGNGTPLGSAAGAALVPEPNAICLAALLLAMCSFISRVKT